MKIIYQFGYCPLIWMFCGRKANSMTNDLHEQALIIVYKNRDLSLDGLLKQDGSFTIDQSNIKTLPIELFKVKQCLFEKRQIVN